jgi:hypothetical protein
MCPNLSLPKPRLNLTSAIICAELRGSGKVFLRQVIKAHRNAIGRREKLVRAGKSEVFSG